MPIPAKKKTSQLPPFTFVRNDLSMLEFRMNIMKPIGCVQFKLSLDELEEPGIFHAWSGHIITIQFLLGEDLAIAYYQGTMDNTIYKMMMLMGRTPIENPRSLECFREFVENQGLNSSEIINPALDERLAVTDMASFLFPRCCAL
uniref:vomeronasal secretory protein 2-like n=1 Tax=Jaculus jaculus TaxID=51337 RepID=UPI001E1B053D|nr:vomeronasal secretory protein 2-like [Jaculus jaculus]